MAEMRVLLSSVDAAARVHFYGEVLGLVLERSWDEPGNRGWMFIAGDEARIEVFENPDYATADAAGVGIGLQVTGVDALVARARTAGVPIAAEPADQPWGHRNARLVDPGGMLVVVFEPIG
jgi:uncharacterized glyoxalase superfamily protein PhnB